MQMNNYTVHTPMNMRVDNVKAFTAVEAVMSKAVNMYHSSGGLGALYYGRPEMNSHSDNQFESSADKINTESVRKLPPATAIGGKLMENGTQNEQSEKVHPLVRIVAWLRRVSFKEDFFTELLLESLSKVLPLVEVDVRQQAKVGVISIDLLYRVTAKVLGKSVGKAPVNDDIRLIYEGAFIMIYNWVTNAGAKVGMEFPDFLVKYPEFADDYRIDAQEKEHLLKFRNMMALCLRVIPAQNHKNHLIDLVTRLAEGKNAKYIVGSGQSDKTSRRVLIYRREGNVPLICKGVMDEGFVSGLGMDLHSQSYDSEEVVQFNTGATAFSDHTTRSSMPSQYNSAHKLEKKRNKHLTYLSSMTQKRQEQLATLRTHAPDVTHTYEVTVQEGEMTRTYTLPNVLSIKQCGNSTSQQSCCDAPEPKMVRAVQDSVPANIEVVPRTTMLPNIVSVAQCFSTDSRHAHDVVRDSDIGPYFIEGTTDEMVKTLPVTSTGSPTSCSVAVKFKAMLALRLSEANVVHETDGEMNVVDDLNSFSDLDLLNRNNVFQAPAKQKSG
jgi:hypothetical protein